jgi:hypothetical protein
LSSEAELRPEDALTISRIVFMSMPCLVPKSTASEVAASAVAERKLLSTFTAWPCPGFGPT